MSGRKKALIGLGVVVCAPVVIAGAVHGATESDAPHAAAASRTTAAAATPSTAAPSPGSSRATPRSARPAAEPTFIYPGDPQCAITYRDRGDGSMSWTATTTIAGKIRTHADSTSGSIYSRVAQTTPGPNAFAAPVPLAQIDDIGGVLFARDASYGCSVRPAP